jgi:hypothetical protein
LLAIIAGTAAIDLWSDIVVDIRIIAHGLISLLLEIGLRIPSRIARAGAPREADSECATQ